MTEKEWLKCKDPDKMLAFLMEKGASDRKLRLFGCACCRQVWNQMKSKRSRNAVETAERFADGECDRATLQRKQRAANAVCNSLAYRDGDKSLSQSEAANLVALVDAGVAALRSSSEIRGHTGKGSRGQIQLLRDIFDNPFHPVVIEPTWLSATVLRLAPGIYDEGAFDRLPILADALEEAGCTNTYLLNHLRDPGPHCKGCWALDLVLAKG